MKTCVITGASGHIGRAIAEALFSEPYLLVAAGRKRPRDWRGEFLECDLAQDADVEALCAYLAANHPLIWGLINVAGQGATGDVHEVDSARFMDILRVNTVAPALLVRGITPLMTMGGRIVSISSIVAEGKRGRSVYAASKMGLNALSACWALELSPGGITSNIVAPGPVDSPLLRSVLPPGSAAERELLATVATGRMTLPAEIAALVQYMLSASAGNLTGQIVRLDGGLSTGMSLQ